MGILGREITNTAISTEGRKNILGSYTCLKKDVFAFFFKHQAENEISNETIINHLNTILPSFPIHLLGTRANKEFIELDALINVREPVVITFIILNDHGNYKIAEIKNLCNLLEKINLWYENSVQTKNENK
jgi:hypothetical protein